MSVSSLPRRLPADAGDVDTLRTQLELAQADAAYWHDYAEQLMALLPADVLEALLATTLQASAPRALPSIPTGRLQ